MIYVESWKSSSKCSYDRLAPRSEFNEKFWSANKVNFDADYMPQSCEVTRLFRGTMAIIEMVEADPTFFPGLRFNAWEFGGVVDAFQFGIRFPDVVREHKQILALGSVGPLKMVPACDLRRFCPSLFVFSEDKDASVVLGIERLEKTEHGLLIPKGTKILVVKHGT